MSRVGCHVKECTIALLAVCAVMGAAAAVAGPDLGTTIRQRLEAAHYPVYDDLGDPSTRPRPQVSFHTVAAYMSSRPFEFDVSVFQTRSLASTAYAKWSAQTDRIGIPSAHRYVLSGRVLYLGATGPLNQTGGPAWPLNLKLFQHLLAVAQGR